jgi:transcriptional regulator with XRE-family HTH domain
MRPIHPEPDQGALRIGAKLRATRLSQGMTIAQVSETTGLTKGFISRLERDETSPSVATLVMICQVLSLPIGSLFERPSGEVIRLADAPRINLGGTRAVELLVTPRDEERFQLLRSTLEPGANGGDDLYTINCDVEAVHVLRGGITLRFASRDVVLDIGDTLTIPGREPHTWVNHLDEESEVIWVIAPAAWSGSA